ncbi:MAG: penicillin-binding protein [Geobacter sp.]|nr:penicillin-binding protein [Geobacter sp.]
MQDIKHITTKHTGRFRRIIPLGRKQHAPRNAFRRPAPETPERRRRLKVLLPLLACLIAAYPLFHLLVSAKNAISSVSARSVRPTALRGELDFAQSFRLANESLPSAKLDGERLLAPLQDGTTVVYAINPELQARVKAVMAEYRVPYGVFVAVEPKSGRILALAAHSEKDSAWQAQAPYNLYPMASLFKIITASAALEQRKVTPQTVLPFRGGLTSENPRYWSVGNRRGNQEMSLTMAMGKSVNPLFGRLAGDVVGKEGIMQGMERFGFNQLLFPGTPITPCSSVTPQDDGELKRMGAGLCRDVKISPFYAALMMAAIANKGMMLQPMLADEIRGSKGKILFSDQAKPVRRVVSPETADQLATMMSTTVSQGTSRKVFRDRRGRPKLAAVDIAAKTGSINGTDPPGHYSWFAAYAPIDDPQIALAALIVNGEKWRIKASLLGEQALEAFFK